ncbi:MAG: aminomethyl-transferring glycine dehydrogenase subunit GcvPB [Acidobacteriota bacterium]
MEDRSKKLREREKLLFEISREGKIGYSPLKVDVKWIEPDVEKEYLREDIKDFPELSEAEIVRHYTRLSQWNYGVDTGFYPLGSCTMKYNPKVNEKLARLDGFVTVHPYQPEKTVQGCLKVIYELERLLSEITGMYRFTLQPAAGAHGELTGMMMIRAYLTKRKDPRKVVLIPDSAHGTNPSSAHICGYRVEEVKSNDDGCIDLKSLEQKVSKDVAALMLTNPNTLGIFERNIEKVAEILHKEGALLYCDGANLNALVGLSRPGDSGVDVLHLNLHKTFSTPHGGGGPGSGPVGVKEELEPMLPIPVVNFKAGKYSFDCDRSDSIGKVHTFYGNFSILIRAYSYILSLGAEGLKEIARAAVLNANYVRKGLEDLYHLPYKTPTLHEIIFSDKHLEGSGVRTLDIAKRLLDYGFHPPTIYFPLIVKGAIMIEPTESESKEELDGFINAMRSISEEAQRDPELLKNAPYSTPVRRLDEVRAARNPRLRWTTEK